MTASAPGTPFSVAEVRPDDTRDFSSATCIGLSFITLGIWGVVAFYRIATRYRRLAALRSVTFAVLFWTWVGTVVASFCSWWLAPLPIASGALTLIEVMRLRDRARQRIAPVGTPQPRGNFRPEEWHVAMFIGVQVCVLAEAASCRGDAGYAFLRALWLYGSPESLAFRTAALVMGVWQMMAFFDEWNAIAGFLRSRLRAEGAW